jgi:hypothetical protein
MPFKKRERADGKEKTKEERERADGKEKTKEERREIRVLRSSVAEVYGYLCRNQFPTLFQFRIS